MSATHCHPVKYNGTEYESLKALCRELNIGYSKVHNRIRKGVPLEQAVREDYNIIDLKYRTGLNGMVFNNTKEMCDYYKISRRNVKEKIDAGFTIEEIIDEKKERKISLNKKRLCNNQTIDDLCKQHNITRSAYDYRMSLGWDMDKILNTPMQEDSRAWKRTHPITKQVYGSIEELCHSLNNGVTAKLYKSRLASGWSQEKALFTLPINTHKGFVDLFGNKFSNYSEAFRYYGIKSSARNLLKNHPISAVLGIIPRVMYSNNGMFKESVIFRENFVISNYCYKGIDKQEYYLCNINGQDIILPRNEIYKRMEEIVIEEHKATGTIQTTESE